MTGPIKGGPVRVSFVVLCLNSERHIGRCVRSLLQDQSTEEDEVWLVDNGSSDGTGAILDRLKDEYPTQVQVVKLDRNLGTTLPRNIALRSAAGRYIAIVDSDAELPDGTVARLIARYEREPAAGILVPRLVYADGRPQMSTDLFPTIGRKLLRYVALRAMESRQKRAAETEIREVDYAISAFWLMSREVVAAVGYFDEEIFYSPEDVDYCIRVWQSGRRVLCDPSVLVIHDAQEISRTFIPGRATFSHLRGLFYLFRKHRYSFSRRALYDRIGRFSDGIGSRARLGAS